jgi:class 3 adenylate cyclase
MAAPETRYARDGDLNLAYQIVGEGPRDLVFVPNWLFNLDFLWQEPLLARFFERLASFSRLILFDRRGSGLSDPVSGAPTLEERMDDIRVVLEAAGSERAAVWAFSEAAPMAALYAATYADKVPALVLYGGYAKTVASPDYPFAPAGDDRRFARVVRDWGSGANIELFAPTAARDPRFRAWWPRFERAAASPASVLRILRLNAELDVRPVLPTITVPTLVLHRRDDAVVPVANSRYIASSIPRAKLVELPGVDHIPMAGDQDEILEETEEFLTGIRHRGRARRVLSTVLFTDIVGSTEQAAHLGDRRWADLLASHDAVVRQELQHFGGREVKTTGDGFLATFDGPERAIRCALACTQAVRTLGIEIRAGLHTGELELLDGDVGGMAVHIAARVVARAGPSEVLVSSTVRDLVVGSGLEFSDAGMERLKGVPGEWRLLAAAA